VERLVIPLGTTRDLARIGSWTDACCAECDITGQAAYHVQLAVDEACANIFEHGYAGHPGPIQLEAEGTDDALTIWIRDWGQSFDPGISAAPNPATSIQERAIGGLGIFLMNRVMDEVTYHFDVGTGNSLKLVKKRPA
jgi:anti-sigma regulatory factor (Ser/Thr protein kinase)